MLTCINNKLILKKLKKFFWYQFGFRSDPEQSPDPYSKPEPLVHKTNPRNRIKMRRIHNTRQKATPISDNHTFLLKLLAIFHLVNLSFSFPIIWIDVRKLSLAPQPPPCSMLSDLHMYYNCKLKRFFLLDFPTIYQFL